MRGETKARMGRPSVAFDHVDWKTERRPAKVTEARGEVVTNDKDKQIVTVRDDADGAEYVIEYRFVRRLPHDHRCLLIPYRRVLWSIEHSNWRKRALDIRLDGGEVELLKRERGVISSWDSSAKAGYGYVKREGCGCSLFLHTNNLTPSLTPSLGEEVEFEVSQTQERCEAVNAILRPINSFKPIYKLWVAPVIGADKSVAKEDTQYENV